MALQLFVCGLKKMSRFSYREKLDLLAQTNAFPQAAELKKMLEEDNERFFKFIDGDDSFKDVPMNDIGGKSDIVDDKGEFRQLNDDENQRQNDNNGYQPLNDD